MANKEVAGTTDPSEEAGSQNTSTTLDALGANIEAIVTPDPAPQGTSDSTPTPAESVIPQAQPANISEVVAQTVTEPSQAQAPSTEPAAEPTTVDDGLAERLRQDNAGMQKILDGLGIDADKREYLKSGLMDAKDILASLTAHTQTILPTAQTGQIPTAQPTETQVPLSQTLTNLETSLSNIDGEVSSDIYQSQMKEVVAGLKTVATELDSQKKDNEQIRADTQQTDLVNWQQSNMNIVHGAVEKATFYDGMKPEMQARVKSLIMGSVNEGVSALANHADATIRAKALSPQAFAYVAQQTINDFNQLLGTTRQTGVDAAVLNIQGNPQSVNPISSGTGTSVVQAPQMELTLESLEANTKTFLATPRARV